MKNKLKHLGLLFAFGILLFAIWGNIAAYAQLNQTSTNAKPPATGRKPGSVRITTPTRGQQIPAGKDLMISGVSKDNATSNCQISVMVNKVKPYQNATAAGNGGPTDFSKWNYVLTSKYTTIKEGQNRITAKFSCVNTPAVASPGFYTINVTGVRAGLTSPTNSSR